MNILQRIEDRTVIPPLKGWVFGRRINGGWYVAKPLPYYSFITLIEHFYHAWLVLIDKAIAVQYAEDRYKNLHKKG